LGRNITEFHASQETIGDIFARLKRRETLLNYEVPLLAKKTKDCVFQTYVVPPEPEADGHCVTPLLAGV
jgi:hypothetical protein